MSPNKNNLYLLIIAIFLFFIICIKIDFFKQFYYLISNNHNTRMIKTFGFCNNDSYGFLKYIERNYKPTENPLILNTKVLPNSLWTIYNSKNKISNSPKIFLGYEQNPRIVFLPKENLFVSQNHVQFTNELKNISFLINGRLINFNGSINIFKIENGKKNNIFEISLNKQISNLEKINVFFKSEKFNSRWGNLYIDIKNQNLETKNKINTVYLEFENKYKFSQEDIIYSYQNCYYIK